MNSNGNNNPKKILVVYPKTCRENIPAEGYRFASRLKTFMLLSEGSRFINCISGMHLCGIIIEEGVNDITHDDFRFFLSRLWADPPSVMLMSKAQAVMLREVCDSLLEERQSYGEDTKQMRAILTSIRYRVTTHPEPPAAPRIPSLN